MAINLDRYAPAFSLKIGGVYHSELKAAITSIEVDENLESPSMFTINVNEGLDIKTQSFRWLDNVLLDPESGEDVEIQLGYAGLAYKLKEPLITGKIFALSPSFPSGGTPILSVQGYDRSFYLQKSWANDRGTFDQEKDYGDIVRTIAKDRNLEEGEIDVSIKPCEKVNQTEESYYAFLKKLANRIGYEFFIRNRKIYFRAPRDNAEEVLTLKWGKELISFSPRMSTAKVVSKVTVKGHNQKDPSKPFIGVATFADLGIGEQKALIFGKSFGLFYGKDVESSEHDLPVCSQEDAQTLAKALLAKANNSLIEGSCECVGTPEVRPGANVRIEGVGRKFSGKYYVKSARHSLGDGGYLTSFEVRRGLAGIN